MLQINRNAKLPYWKQSRPLRRFNAVGHTVANSESPRKEKRTGKEMTFKELLKENCINQAELARKMGVSRERISLWARGTTKPRPANIKKIAEVMRLPYNTVLQAFYGEHTA